MYCPRKSKQTALCSNKQTATPLAPGVVPKRHNFYRILNFIKTRASVGAHVVWQLWQRHCVLGWEGTGGKRWGVVYKKKDKGWKKREEEVVEELGRHYKIWERQVKDCKRNIEATVLHELNINNRIILPLWRLALLPTHPRSLRPQSLPSRARQSFAHYYLTTPAHIHT